MKKGLSFCKILAHGLSLGMHWYRCVHFSLW